MHNRWATPSCGLRIKGCEASMALSSEGTAECIAQTALHCTHADRLRGHIEVAVG